jgi:hypothetical protein
LSAPAKSAYTIPAPTNAFSAFNSTINILTSTAITTSSLKYASTSTFQTKTTTVKTLTATKIATHTSTSATTSVSTTCVSHYWPVANKAVEDVIGHQNAMSNESPQFTRDRFGLANGALRLFSKETAWRLPHGRYFKGDTTITLWIKKIECNGFGPFGNCFFLFNALNSKSFDRFIKYKSKVCLGTMTGKANVYISSLSDCSDFFEMNDPTRSSYFINYFGSIKVPVETWYHLAYVYKATTVLIYVNGTFSGSKSGFYASSSVNAVREPNFIGMGFNTEGILWVPNIVLDEIKLFNKALTQEQIIRDMNARDEIASGIC